MSRLKTKPEKTLGMRVLERNHIPYEPCYYEVEGHLPTDAVATAIGMAPEQIFKTLVVEADAPGNGPILACIPANTQLDLKKLATAAEIKGLHMASQREAERLTGLEKGGISPLALLDRGFRVIVDETIVLHERVEISAGKVGVGIIVRADDLLRLLAAQTADVCR
jgi:Cys-tRNA(Pro)/Cys-tRNA(Cys) deacylase